MNSDPLDQFVRDIVADKRLPGVDDDEVREQLVTDLKERLLDQVDRAMVDALPDDKVDGFNELLDNEATTDEQIQAYIAQSGVDTQQVATDTMVRFRELYLAPPEAHES